MKYPYGASVKDAAEKLKYDLYYIKNMSLGFDFFIIFGNPENRPVRKGSPLTVERWYVVQTKPRKESTAENYLASKRIETFNPHMEHASVRNGRITTAAPLPGYLFARFDFNRSYSLVRWGRGVNKVIGFGEYPTPLAEEVILIIQQRTNKDNVVKKAYP